MSLNVTETIYLHILCPTCNEGILKPVAFLATRSNLSCKGCGGVIELDSPENRFLITETERHCRLIEAALKKQIKAVGLEERNQGQAQRKAQKRPPARAPIAGDKAVPIQAR